MSSSSRVEIEFKTDVLSVSSSLLSNSSDQYFGSFIIDCVSLTAFDIVSDAECRSDKLLRCSFVMFFPDITF